ncbi:MAG: hypothetical protein K2Q13_01875 [Nitrosomonas sp.]|uniref:PEP-CTERM sorting domain-containing protein n=1 Tax=Nitrosomonas sp. TaxID=42353 RepID=UPI0025FCE69C|nr:PEP-CTERM sorting domain-containing protein [Nitrosomonas sp.]MBY0473791.1 hypothetical protein [Nitrosomonas sp.]
MKILKWLKQIALAVGFVVTLGGTSHAGASGSIFIKNLGPLNSFTVDIASSNRTDGMIQSLRFDLLGTQCGNTGCTLGEPLVFDAVQDSGFVHDPAGDGVSSLFGVHNALHFGFNFTGYDPLDKFQFLWDPDVASNGDYAATVSDLIGMVIRASVIFPDNSTLIYSGTMAAVDSDVAVNLLPVPEPRVYAMLAVGLGFLGFIRYRSKQVEVA